MSEGYVQKRVYPAHNCIPEDVSPSSSNQTTCPCLTIASGTSEAPEVDLEPGPISFPAICHDPQERRKDGLQEE